MKGEDLTVLEQTTRLTHAFVEATLTISLKSITSELNLLNGSRLYYKTIKCEKILPIQLQRTTPPSGAPNDSFLLNTLKTLFRLSRVLLDV